MPLKYYGSYFASGNDTFDIQRSYHFVMDLTALNDTEIGGDAHEFSLAVQNVKIPDFNNNAIELAHGSTSVKYSGQAEYSDIDVTIVDFVGVDIEKWLSAWYDKVCMQNALKGNNISNLNAADFGQVGKQNFSSAYKKNAKLRQLAPDGSSQRIWELYGIFPTSFNPGSFDYSSNDKKQISMTFSVDFAWRT